MLSSLLPALAVGLSFVAPAFADNHAAAGKAGDVVIEQAWSRASPKSAVNGAAFMTLRNSGAKADALVSVESPAAGMVELHATSLADGVMQMRHVERIELPVGQAVELKPGGYHVMLMGLKAPLQAGQMVDLKLNFASGASASVKAPIAAAGAPTPMHSGH